MAKTPTKSVKEILDAEQKVRMIIPSNPNLKPEDDFVVVRINDYAYKIMAGKYVDLPETVAKILSDSNKGLADIANTYADMTIGGGRNLSETPASKKAKE